MAIQPQLSDEELVGQLFVWGIPGTTLSSASADLIKNTHPAGVILMGQFTEPELKHMTEDIKRISTTVPLFIAIDQEGGTVTRLTEDTLPGGRELGALNTDDFCGTIASRSALLSKNGVNTNFGIIGDIGWNDKTYMWQRTYTNTAEEVAQKVGDAIGCSHSIITVVKHFPGHSDTTLNSHYTIPIINKDEPTWRNEDGLPFFRAIEKGVDMIMVGHIQYPKIASEPASLSKKFHDIVKEKNFKGLIITDDLGMLESSGYELNATIRQAIDAKNDLLLITSTDISPLELYTNLLDEATQSTKRMNTIKTSVNHTLQFKSQQRSL